MGKSFATASTWSFNTSANVLAMLFSSIRWVWCYRRCTVEFSLCKVILLVNSHNICLISFSAINYSYDLRAYSQRECLGGREEKISTFWDDLWLMDFMSSLRLFPCAVNSLAWGPVRAINGLTVDEFHVNALDFRKSTSALCSAPAWAP